LRIRPPPRPPRFPYTTLFRSLERADIITIHLPKTPETQGIIGATALSKVKPGVLIVNAARGGLVDENALAEALREGRVAGAGIRSEEHTSELQSRENLVCRLL